MKKLLYIPGVILALCALMTVFLSSIESVIYGGMELYETEYEKYGVCEFMDMEMDDLLDVMEHTIEYMRGNEDEFQVTTTVAGERVEFYNERETAHMIDVRALVIGAFFLRAALVCAALGCLLIILAARPPRLARLLAVSFLAGRSFSWRSSRSSQCSRRSILRRSGPASTESSSRTTCGC